MLDAMENAYDIIISNQGSHDDYMMHIFSALLSSKNTVFKDYIQVFKNQWEDDENKPPPQIISKLKSKFANMPKVRIGKEMTQKILN